MEVETDRQQENDALQWALKRADSSLTQPPTQLHFNVTFLAAPCWSGFFFLYSLSLVPLLEFSFLKPYISTPCFSFVTSALNMEGASISETPTYETTRSQNPRQRQ
jgi:hypothetical protein